MKMADLDINSKYKMLSGYDIPALGYGVRKYFLYFLYNLTQWAELWWL